MFIWILINYYLLWLLWLCSRLDVRSCIVHFQFQSTNDRNVGSHRRLMFIFRKAPRSRLALNAIQREEENKPRSTYGRSIYLITSRVEDLLCSSSWSQNDNKQHAAAGEAITILFDLTNKMGNIFDIFQCFVYNAFPLIKLGLYLILLH